MERTDTQRAFDALVAVFGAAAANNTDTADGAGVVINFGRRRRLFTGPLRQAVLLAERRCLWPGCNRPSSHCQADHTLPFNTDGPTQADNAGPLCAHHNRWKTRGYRTWRDPNGHWHTQRPDNTVIGWRIQEIDLAA